MVERGRVRPEDAGDRDFSLRGAEHVQKYLETDGEVGHIWNGVTCLVLWTTGRKTGERRAQPLIYGSAGDDVVLMASYGGASHHPSWYLNLVAKPDVEVQVGADRYAGRARTAAGDERARLWKTMAGIWPDLDDYQARTERTIPIVVVERV
jgi:deazaflavin-dependent oxidoreductase (nitroreductase family)